MISALGAYYGSHVIVLDYETVQAARHAVGNTVPLRHCIVNPSAPQLPPDCIFSYGPLVAQMLTDTFNARMTCLGATRAAGRVPQLRGVVVAARHDRLAVRAERHRQHPAGVPAQRGAARRQGHLCHPTGATTLRKSHAEPQAHPDTRHAFHKPRRPPRADAEPARKVLGCVGYVETGVCLLYTTLHGLN